MAVPDTIKQRHAQPGNRNVAKQPMANPSSVSRTVRWHDIPEWRRDNKYILSGYRPLEADYLKVIKSLTFLHNETCNVCTHLIGAVLLPSYATTILQTTSWPKHADLASIDFIMFNIFFCSAESCLIFSAVYHLVGSHSHEVEQRWHRRDLLGIVNVTVGTFISGIYYIFYCDPVLQKIHWIIVCHSSHSDTLGRETVTNPRRMLISSLGNILRNSHSWSNIHIQVQDVTVA
ncbi:uncharacterized protein FFNC_15598 [Fusarium fujikuroi]|nr:uncharacterized protein FFNC_15598 [Fusarium fujikuroi]